MFIFISDADFSGEWTIELGNYGNLLNSLLKMLPSECWILVKKDTQLYIPCLYCRPTSPIYVSHLLYFKSNNKIMIRFELLLFDYLSSTAWKHQKLSTNKSNLRRCNQRFGEQLTINVRKMKTVRALFENNNKISY